MPEYAEICVNMPKSAWIALVLHVPIVIPSLLERVVTYFNKVYNLKEHKVVFLKRPDLFFSIVAESIWFFCFRLNTFTSKILSLLLPFGAQEAKGLESWYAVIK